MKLTPRAGGERGSAAAPVLRAGESRGGSGLLRPRGWRGRGRCPCGSLASAPLGSARLPPGIGPAGGEGGGGGRPLFPLPLLLLSAGGGVGHRAPFGPPSTRVTCRSRHGGERRVGWLPPPRGLPTAFPLMMMVAAAAGGRCPERQRSPTFRGLSGCLAARRRRSGIGSNCRQRMSPAEGKTKAASKDPGAEFGKAPKDTN